MRDLVQRVRTPADWAPLEAFIAVEDFERIGVFREVQDWPAYTEMLTHWATSVDSFETTVRRISELPGLVYYEIEECHRRGEALNVVNSMTVFTFDEAGKISHLDVYLQQASPAPTEAS
ncbi:MAG TPA: hypothetical protein VEH82_08720 [Acidimicrobiales bacterium]|nr:hypothetical protein [Acidimicrobiales bacterium]